MNPDKNFYEIPKEIKNNAKKALNLIEQGYKGGTETGLKRARQLVNDRYLSLDDIRDMRNWFARHLYTSYPGYKKFNYYNAPNRGAIAWLLWGGSDAIGYLNNLTDELNSTFNKNYKKLELY